MERCHRCPAFRLELDARGFQNVPGFGAAIRDDFFCLLLGIYGLVGLCIIFSGVRIWAGAGGIAGKCGGMRVFSDYE
jgi:hypothetical protein